MTEATQTCTECGSELDRREGPLGVSYQCLNLECGSTFARDEIDETAPAKQALLPVTQADRDAAAAYVRDRFDDDLLANEILRGTCDRTSMTVQAFAHHRIAALTPSPCPGDVGMREAAQAVIDTADDYYTARNGRRMSIEGSDGEKCWIVPFDQFEDLRRALVATDTWMTISVDEAAQTIGIDHPTKADWLDVYRALVAVRDHINDRIAKQEACPVRPAALTPSALSGDAGEGE